MATKSRWNERSVIAHQSKTQECVGIAGGEAGFGAGVPVGGAVGRGRRRRAFCGERRRGGCPCPRSCRRESGSCSPTVFFRTLCRMLNRRRDGKSRLRPMRLFSVGFQAVPRGTGPCSSWASPVSRKPCFPCPSLPRKSLFSPSLSFVFLVLFVPIPSPSPIPSTRQVNDHPPPNAFLLCW